MVINIGKVVLGGLAAGAVLAVGEGLSHALLLGDRLNAELEAVAPSMAERLTASAAVAVFIAMYLALGILLAWLYAAVRPRFGPGIRTAAMVGGFLWLVASVLHLPWLVGGLISAGSYLMTSATWLVTILAAAAVAGRLYAEEAPAAAATRAM